ncbi:MAG TPA: aspartate/glutamate racemase family protein [Burkholderiales bacterium]|nr:aspartate/glutamate racemase family protein [Burkholderiales bacterium]
MSERIFLGMLTPSSNTVLEPVTARMLEGLPEVTAHFSRFRVTEISLEQHSIDHFQLESMLAAADLLADAKCRSICWNGTSSSWLGFERDRELCGAIEARTGIRACSSVLAIHEIFRASGVRRFGMVSPYTGDVVDAIRHNFARDGFELIAERHCGIKVNFDFSEIARDAIVSMAREVAAARPDAIIVLCTNMDGASLAGALERETGIPLYDSIATAVWASLRSAGVHPSRVEGWGRLFREVK